MSKTTRQLVFEGIGTFLLVLSIVGSGIFGSQLTDNTALILLINASAIVATLYVLISVLLPVSGAYFNPAVVLFQVLRNKLEITTGLLLVVAQIIGGILGAIFANYTFGQNPIQISNTDRFSLPVFFAEILATAGLIFIVSRHKKFSKESQLPAVISLWIFGAIFFTSSTAFANPAVTVARVFSDTFTGISVNSAISFIAAQVLGVLIVYVYYLLNKSLKKYKQNQSKKG